MDAENALVLKEANYINAVPSSLIKMSIVASSIGSKCFQT